MEHKSEEPVLSADEWHAQFMARHHAAMARYWAAVAADLRRRTLIGRLRYWLTGY